MAVTDAAIDLLRAWLRAARSDDFDTLFDLSTDDLAESFLAWGLAKPGVLAERFASIDVEHFAVLTNERVVAPNLEMVVVIWDPEIIAAGVVGGEGPVMLTAEQSSRFLLELGEDGWRVVQWSEASLQRYEAMFATGPPELD